MLGQQVRLLQTCISQQKVITHLIAALLLAGQAETHSDLVKRLTANELRVAELSIKQNRASQTTQTAQKLGAVSREACNPCACSSACFSDQTSWHVKAGFYTQVWIQRATKLLQLPCIEPISESSPVVAQAYTAVLGKFSRAPYNIPAQTGKVFASE